MSAPILITGATGHIGFRVLIHALTAGHTIRAAVRSQSKANMILSHPLIQNLNPGSRLSFTIVPDLTQPNAYDDAAEGVSHIIHIASPLRISSADDEIPMNEQDAFFIQPAVRGTLNVLHAAKKARTVRRVVITSSLVALVPVQQLTGQEDRPAYLGPVQPHDRIPFVSGPYENEFEAYAASKIAALQEAEAWVSRQGSNIAFDVVYLHPAFVEGRNDLASNAREVLKGTNTLVLGQVLGKKFDHPVAGATVHVEDVARVHVQALNQYVPGNTSYILSQSARWEDVRRIVKREFTDAVQKRILPNCGSAETHHIDVDASLTEDVFGFQHIGFAEQVRSVVGHYLELRVRRSAARGLRKSSAAGVGMPVIYGEALRS
ncbi:NAD(P)-binding protein [Trichodelitschia bisporula]|uniref:NAD(P)-binding protein n=1 Tax=Trichodelitschia bisporula TaxID=703511 RepID=A0A6G1HM55_9PEZI|nr:NAD(P)-binding protein [Trichodelitschia bisporula]